MGGKRVGAEAVLAEGAVAERLCVPGRADEIDHGQIRHHTHESEQDWAQDVSTVVDRDREREAGRGVCGKFGNEKMLREIVVKW